MFFQDLKKILRQNIREYGMYIALFAIMVIFTYTTDGLFISSRNLSNLLNQVGYIAVLAVGMTVVIVIRHIDLSVGFLAGFLGAVAAIMMSSWGWPVYVVIRWCWVLALLRLYHCYPGRRRASCLCGFAGGLVDLPWSTGLIIQARGRSLFRQNFQCHRKWLHPRYPILPYG
jgi:hypothetical protein